MKHLGFVVVLATLTACAGPADVQERQADYERLMTTAVMTGDPLFQWNLATAPPEAKRQMQHLGLRYVQYDVAQGIFIAWTGGGYSQRQGYLYRLPRPDNVAAPPDTLGPPLVGRWYAWP